MIVNQLLHNAMLLVAYTTDITVPERGVVDAQLGGPYLNCTKMTIICPLM